MARLGLGPSDPVHDFGFSKDGDDTFARWDEALVSESHGHLVTLYRRPDQGWQGRYQPAAPDEDRHPLAVLARD